MNKKQRLAYSKTFGVLSFVSLVLLGILAIVLMNHSVYTLLTNFWAGNPLISQTNTVFAPASHIFWNIQYRWLVVAFCILTLISPTIFILNEYYKMKIKLSAASDWWLEFGIASILIAFTIALLSGVQDVATLLIIAILIFIFMATSLYVSKNSDAKKSLPVTLITYFSGFGPYLLILIYMLGTLIYGSLRSPWYVYIIGLLGLANIVSVVIYTYKPELIMPTKDKSTDSLNFNFKTLYQAVKILFVIILLIGLAK